MTLIGIAFVANAAAQPVRDAEATTAWHQGKFRVDRAGVVSRSDIVLRRPNVNAGEALPLGNGQLGAAVWSADGLTVQLNRADTLPERLSTGQLVVMGLSRLIGADDYAGRLDLYNGEIRESGGGMQAKVYVQPGMDVLVVDITGAEPGVKQTAYLKLWEPRKAKAVVRGRLGMLSEGWIDNQEPESSGRHFGSMSAIRAMGRDVVVRMADPLTIEVTFKPYVDGHYRILVASPHYDGTEQGLKAVRNVMRATPVTAHTYWWHAYWARTGLIKVTSTDGSGDYMENLRNIYLFAAAAEKGSEYPGSQAGVADMFSSAKDMHRWAASAFWHWNLRMQVAANLGAGLPELNAPYFNLYRENLSNIENWTKQYMHGRPGSCVPETMRFNGKGIEYESSWKPISIGRDCDLDVKPYYNSRTLSTGAEVGLWVWQQYLQTEDRAFLNRNYPLMTSASRFLLAYQKLGADGFLHTSPSNSHETQWDVTDPTTDIAAAMALYPVTIEAAKLLHKDAELVEQLQSALPKIPPFPRTQIAEPRNLLTPAMDEEGEDMIAESYLIDAKNHNAENIGLEPVWPYNLIGDSSPSVELAKRTYAHRLFSGVADWSFDPIQAARLGMGNEVATTLVKITEHSQHSINGFANWDVQYGEFYVEQVGVVAAALQEALVQDYDGLIRIAPAVPPGWNFDGTVAVAGRTKVDAQVRLGKVISAVIEAGRTQPIKFRNPWPGELVDIIAGNGSSVRKTVVGNEITFNGVAGTHYVLERHERVALDFAEITGSAAQSVRKLGGVQIGLDVAADK